MTKNLVAIFIILALGIGVLLGYYIGYDIGFETAVQTNNYNAQKPENNSPDSNSTVKFDEYDNNNYYGALILTGYLDVKTRVCNPGDMCERTVEYASFVFTESSSDAIYDFLGVNTGNSFVGDTAIGLGCYEKDKNRIFYENFADVDSVQGEIKGQDLAKLLASNKTNPVKLEMKREIYTSGRGAPDCYTHFRDFAVL